MDPFNYQRALAYNCLKTQYSISTLQEIVQPIIERGLDLPQLKEIQAIEDTFICAKPNRLPICEENGFIFEPISFQLKVLKAYLEKAFSVINGGECWLVGSAALLNEIPYHDLDIAFFISPYATQETYDFINTTICQFIALVLKESSSFNPEKTPIDKLWLLKKVYYTNCIKFADGSGALYSISGVDIKIISNPRLYCDSPTSGIQISLSSYKMRINTGKEIVTDENLFDQILINARSRMYQAPYYLEVEGLLFRLLFKLTQGHLFDSSILQYAIHQFKRNYGAKFITNKLAKHQLNHYPDKIGRVIDFLNLVAVLENDHEYVRWITHIWLNLTSTLELHSIHDFAKLIVKFPNSIPHLLAFIRGVIFLEWAKQEKDHLDGYLFSFDPDQIRLFFSLSGEKDTYFLAIPSPGSPVHLAISLLKAMPILTQKANEYSVDGLNVLSDLLCCLGVSSRYLEKGYIEKELLSAFDSPHVKYILNEKYHSFYDPRTVFEYMKQSQDQTILEELEYKLALNHLEKCKVASQKFQIPELASCIEFIQTYTNEASVTLHEVESFISCLKLVLNNPDLKASGFCELFISTLVSITPRLFCNLLQSSDSLVIRLAYAMYQTIHELNILPNEIEKFLLSHWLKTLNRIPRTTIYNEWACEFSKTLLQKGYLDDPQLFALSIEYLIRSEDPHFLVIFYHSIPLLQRCVENIQDHESLKSLLFAFSNCLSKETMRPSLELLELQATVVLKFIEKLNKIESSIAFLFVEKLVFPMLSIIQIQTNEDASHNKYQKLGMTIYIKLIAYLAKDEKLEIQKKILFRLARTVNKKLYSIRQGEHFRIFGQAYMLVSKDEKLKKILQLNIQDQQEIIKEELQSWAKQTFPDVPLKILKKSSEKKDDSKSLSTLQFQFKQLDRSDNFADVLTAIHKISQVLCAINYKPSLLERLAWFITQSLVKGKARLSRLSKESFAKLQQSLFDTIQMLSVYPNKHALTISQKIFQTAFENKILPPKELKKINLILMNEFIIMGRIKNRDFTKNIFSLFEKIYKDDLDENELIILFKVLSKVNLTTYAELQLVNDFVTALLPRHFSGPFIPLALSLQISLMTLSGIKQKKDQSIFLLIELWKRLLNFKQLTVNQILNAALLELLKALLTFKEERHFNEFFSLLKEHTILLQFAKVFQLEIFKIIHFGKDKQEEKLWGFMLFLAENNHEKAYSLLVDYLEQYATNCKFPEAIKFGMLLKKSLEKGDKEKIGSLEIILNEWVVRLYSQVQDPAWFYRALVVFNKKPLSQHQELALHLLIQLTKLPYTAYTTQFCEEFQKFFLYVQKIHLKGRDLDLFKKTETLLFNFVEYCYKSKEESVIKLSVYVLLNYVIACHLSNKTANESDVIIHLETYLKILLKSKFTKEIVGIILEQNYNKVIKPYFTQENCKKFVISLRNIFEQDLIDQSNSIQCPNDLSFGSFEEVHRKHNEREKAYDQLEELVVRTVNLLPLYAFFYPELVIQAIEIILKKSIDLSLNLPIDLVDELLTKSSQLEIFKKNPKKYQGFVMDLTLILSLIRPPGCLIVFPRILEINEFENFFTEEKNITLMTKIYRQLGTTLLGDALRKNKREQVKQFLALQNTISQKHRENLSYLLNMSLFDLILRFTLLPSMRHALEKLIAGKKIELFQLKNMIISGGQQSEYFCKIIRSVGFNHKYFEQVFETKENSAARFLEKDPLAMALPSVATIIDGCETQQELDVCISEEGVSRTAELVLLLLENFIANCKTQKIPDKVHPKVMDSLRNRLIKFVTLSFRDELKGEYLEKFEAQLKKIITGA